MGWGETGLIPAFTDLRILEGYQVLIISGALPAQYTGRCDQVSLVAQLVKNLPTMWETWV